MQEGLTFRNMGLRNYNSSDDQMTESSRSRRIRTISDPPISEKRKFAHAVGAMARAATNQLVTVYFTAYLLQVALLPPLYTALVVIFGRVMDALTDPFLGFFFAKINTRFGKYKPWLLIASPVAAICFTLLWYIPNTESQLQKFLYYFFIYWFYFVGITGYYIPLLSLALCCTNSPSERDSLTTRRMAFEYIGAIMSVGLTALFLYIKQTPFDPSITCGHIFSVDELTGIENSSHVSILDQYLRYRHSLYEAHFYCGVTLSAIFLTCAALAFFSLEERYHLHTDSMEFKSLLHHYRQILRFKPYNLLATIYFLLSIALTSVVGNYQLYFKYVLHSADTFPSYVFLLYLMATLSAGVWHRFLLKRFGKKTTATAATIPLIIIVWYHLYFEGSPGQILTIAIFGGITLGGVFLVPNSMAPDAIAAYSIQHGYGKESLFYTLVGSLDKFGIGLSLGFSNLMLNFAGLDITNPCRQPDSVAQTLRVIISAVPVISLTISIILLWEYPITEFIRSQMDDAIKRSMSSFSRMNNNYYGSLHGSLPVYTESAESLSRSGSMSKREKPMIPRYTTAKETITEVDNTPSGSESTSSAVPSTTSDESTESETRYRSHQPKRKYGVAGLESFKVPFFYLDQGYETLDNMLT